MVWQVYVDDFTAQSLSLGASQRKISSLLSYAKKLYDKGFPIIYDIGHLAALVGYKEDYVVRAAIRPSAYYRSFQIKKKSGGVRVISEPLPSLKEVQKWVLKNILEVCPVSPFAKAYVRGRSIKENARFHRGQSNVLKVDIKKFFPSISKAQIYSLFLSIGYTKGVSSILAKLCCINDGLPQGAPTSPALSNILLNAFDYELFQFCQENKVRFTRYADDITFSYLDKGLTGKLVEHTVNLLSKQGLVLNHSKTRLMERHQRQEVTGIVVNEKLQVSITLRKELRKTFYFINKYGIDSHIERIGESRKRYIYHIIGMCNFVLFINPHDEEIKGYYNIARSYINELGSSSSR
jgi:RNA-directed DNA polymerase